MILGIALCFFFRPIQPATLEALGLGGKHLIVEAVPVDYVLEWFGRYLGEFS